MPDLFANYDLGSGSFCDEMFTSAGKPRAHYVRLAERFSRLDGMRELQERQQLADQTFLRRGVTFTVYSDDRGTEKIFPFDSTSSRGSCPRPSGRISRPASSNA
jgi:uncharacterized circularly permuted ATP-grasp superfamily protein